MKIPPVSAVTLTLVKMYATSVMIDSQEPVRPVTVLEEIGHDDFPIFYSSTGKRARTAIPR